MKHRTWIAVTAAALAAALLAPVVAGSFSAPLFAKDDPVKLKEKRDKYRKDQEEKGVLCYVDLAFGVKKGTKEAPNKSLDSRWSREAPPSDSTEEKGIQFIAKFSDTKFPEGSGITVIVQKWVQKTGTSVSTLSLEKAGMTAEVADKPKVILMFYTEMVKTFSDVVGDKCTEPKKVKIGPAELYASVYGTNPDSKKRQRDDFYVWSTPNQTYHMRASFTGICVDKIDAFEDKVTELLKATAELKAPD